MSYIQFATIKEEIKTLGCLRRKLQQPFAFNLSTTNHKRTMKGPQATTAMHHHQAEKSLEQRRCRGIAYKLSV
jgi:hypothetical protein